MNELPHELAQALEALKDRAEQRAARVDAEAVAARVVARLRETRVAQQPRIVRPWPLPAWARVAAVLLLVVSAGIIGTVAVRGPSAPPERGLPVMVKGLGTLDEAQYQAVLEAAATVRPVVSSKASRGNGFTTLDHLSEAELAALLEVL